METDSLVIFLVCAFFAEMIGTTAGFGAATILTPVAAHFMDMRTAVALVAFFHVFGNLSRQRLFWRKIDWRLFRLFGLSSLAFTLLGAWLSARIGSPALKGAFGAFLLAYVALSFLGRRPRFSPGPATAAAGGIGSGFVAGLMGTGGAIRSACLLSFGLEKEAYVGTSAAIAFFVDLTRIPVYMAQGFDPLRWLPVLALLLVTAYAGARAGRVMVDRLNPRRFVQFVLVLLGLVGGKFLWEALAGS